MGNDITVTNNIQMITMNQQITVKKRWAVIFLPKKKQNSMLLWWSIDLSTRADHITLYNSTKGN